MQKKILIVEDERLLLRTLADALEERGYSVKTAASAEEAEPLLFPRGGFDLVVLDNRLPGRQGVDVLRRIRDASLPVRVIVMTAYGTNGLETELDKLKVDAYVKKPFDLEKFLEAIAGIVGGEGT